MVVAGLLVLVFGADLAIGIPFGKAAGWLISGPLLEMVRDASRARDDLRTPHEHGQLPERVATPERAEAAYRGFATYLAEQGYPPREGVFGASMLVRLENDGPVTLLLDSEKEL